MKTHLEDLFTALHESEINLEFSWLWDGGFEVRIGDRLNGFVAEKTFQNWPGVMQVSTSLRKIDAFALSHSLTELTDKNGKRLYVVDLLDPIKKAVFERYAAEREDKEIAAFLDNVQNFRQQVRELEQGEKEQADGH